jgi:hypothetical protein
MAGLSYSALNALSGGGYGPNNADAEALYGLGRASSGFDLKKLQEQLALQKAGLGLDFYNQGFDVSTSDISDLLGMDIGAPQYGLGRASDTTRVGNMANLMNMYGYSRAMGSVNDAIYGGTGEWGNISNDLYGQLGKGSRSGVVRPLKMGG